MTARLMAPEKPVSKMSGTPPPKWGLGGSGSRIGLTCLESSPINIEDFTSEEREREELSEGIELDWKSCTAVDLTGILGFYFVFHLFED